MGGLQKGDHVDPMENHLPLLAQGGLQSRGSLTTMDNRTPKEVGPVLTPESDLPKAKQRRGKWRRARLASGELLYHSIQRTKQPAKRKRKEKEKLGKELCGESNKNPKLVDQTFITEDDSTTRSAEA